MRSSILVRGTSRSVWVALRQYVERDPADLEASAGRGKGNSRLRAFVSYVYGNTARVQSWLARYQRKNTVVSTGTRHSRAGSRG